jgi:hypothetical protein
MERALREKGGVGAHGGGSRFSPCVPKLRLLPETPAHLMDTGHVAMKVGSGALKMVADARGVG